MIPRACRLWALGLALLAPCAVHADAESAQAPPPAAAAVAPAPLISVGEIEPHAEQVADQLRRMEDSISDSAAFDALGADVARVSQRAAKLWDDTARLLEAAPRRSALDSIGGSWNALHVDLDRLGDELEERERRRESDLAALTALGESWTSARRDALAANVPAPLVERIDGTLTGIATTRAAIEQRRDQVLVLEDTLSRALQASEDARGRIEDARGDAVRRAFSSRERPAWQALREGRLRDAAGSDRLAQELRGWLEPLTGYLAANREGFVFTLLLWVLLGALLRWSAAPAPFASALLVTITLTVPLRNAPPVILRYFVGLSGLGAALVLLRPVATSRAFAAACAVSALLVVDMLRTLLWVWPGLEQAVLLGEFSLGAALFLWAGRDLPAPVRSRAARLWLTRPFALVCALAASAAAAGFLELSDYLGSGVIVLAATGLVVDAVRNATSALVTHARGRIPPSGLPRLEQGTQRVFDAAAIVMWLYILLDRYSLREPVVDAVTQLLVARVQLGGVSLSLGGALRFVATVLAGWLLSRLVVFVLDVGVFPRASLPRGVPYALSSLARYGVLLAGLLIALTTLGLDLTHLTLLVSALGLGLGFGLQQIVQNFVSGLILLFERPVQIGDAIQLAELTGVVERIGIRSSTLRTFDGAEVIVPNGQLVEARITNWTLSDRRRRIDLPLTVGGSRDPVHVLAQVLEVAKSDPRIGSAPPPEALLLRFSEDSLELELRVWTDEPNWIGVKSDLAIALHAALRTPG